MQKDSKVIHKLKCITIISLIFMTVQILGGIMANSLAILADAFHLASDVLAYVISLQAVLMSHKIPPIYMTFGYHKVQPLGALINIAIIWFVTIQLVVQATQRIINKSIVQEPLYMLLTSFFGLGCNLYIMRVLHSDTQHGGHTGCSHSHGQHDHNHSHHHNYQNISSHGSKKCTHNHSHDQMKSNINNNQKKQQHKHNKCAHTHAHGHSHHHHHDHDHQQNQHNKRQHDHHHEHHQKHNDKHDHDHDHQHQHQHQHDHDHDNEQHITQTHSHDCHHIDEPYNKTEQQLSHRQFVCDINHDHIIDNKNCSQKQKLQYIHLDQKYSVKEQIDQTFSSCKFQQLQTNVNEDNFKMLHIQKNRKQFFSNINIQAAYIHIISDIILSIGVIISAIIIFFGADPTQWTYLQLADPFCTYFFSLMAIYTTSGIVKDSVIILLDGCDDKQLVKQLSELISNIPGISSLKQFKLWSLNRQKYCAALKITLQQQKYTDNIKRSRIKTKIIQLFTTRQITHFIQINSQQEQKNIMIKNS